MIKRKDIKIFIILFLFSCVVFLPWIIHHLTTDSFMIYDFGYKEYAIQRSFVDGRIFMGFISLLAQKLNLPILVFNSILLVLALAVSCSIVIVLKNIVLRKKDVNNNWKLAFVILVCYYTIFNFLYIANLNYAEAFVMAISILFYILAADILVNKQKGYILKALLYLIIGVFMYQATISAFYICIILFSFMSNKSYKDLLKKFILGIIIGALAVGLDFLQIKIISNILGITQKRIGISINYFNYIYYLFCFMIRNSVYTAHLFPNYLYIIFAAMIEGIILTFVEDNKKILKEQILLIIFSIVLSYIPSIISGTAMESGRMRFSMGMTIGILFIHLIIKANLLDKNKIVNKVLILVFICYGLCNTISYINMMRINGIVNYLDKEYIYEIDDYISRYEKENNIKVKNISLLFIDTSPSKAYYIKETLCINIEIGLSAAKTRWSAIGCINYYTNRNLKENRINIEDKEKYIKLVQDSGKEYLCLDDNIYMLIYMTDIKI